jgi:hypothetical protein
VLGVVGTGGGSATWETRLQFFVRGNICRCRKEYPLKSILIVTQASGVGRRGRRWVTIADSARAANVADSPFSQAKWRNDQSPGMRRYETSGHRRAGKWRLHRSRDGLLRVSLRRQRLPAQGCPSRVIRSHGSLTAKLTANMTDNRGRGRSTTECTSQRSTPMDFDGRLRTRVPRSSKPSAGFKYPSASRASPNICLAASLVCVPEDNLLL